MIRYVEYLTVVCLNQNVKKIAEKYREINMKYNLNVQMHDIFKLDIERLQDSDSLLLLCQNSDVFVDFASENKK